LAIFILLISQSNFHLLVLIRSDNFCRKLGLCAMQFGADRLRHRVHVTDLQSCLSFVLLLVSLGAVASEFCMQSVGQERNEYRHF